MNNNQQDCTSIEAMLPDYFEDTLSGADCAIVENHAQGCISCRSLIHDVDEIRSDASTMPDLVPPSDMWAGIEARIQPRVVSINAPASRPGLSRVWLAAAAVTLVASTSAVTYLATSRSAGQPGAPIAQVSQAAVAPGASTAQGRESVSGVDAGSGSTEVPRGDVGRTRAPVSEGPGSRLASAGGVAATALATMPYEGEISELQSALSERRTQLDPATVKVVEDNLKLIDIAVRQAREALLRDPASGFLTEQLNNALEKKVGLLRTAAMLPSSS